MENSIREKESEEHVKVYVAVKKKFEEGKENLRWLLEQTSAEKPLRIFITHVQIPSEIISSRPRRNFPVDKVKEKEFMDKYLDDYVAECSRHKAQADKLVIEADDVARGLLQLIAIHKIENLVMGAASDKQYSSQMNAPTSETALTVKKHADPSCTIWFVCKGNLIHKKEALSNLTQVIPPTSTSNYLSTGSKRFHAETSSSNTIANFLYKHIFGRLYSPPNTKGSIPRNTMITEESSADNSSQGILDARTEEVANELAGKHDKDIYLSSPLENQENGPSAELADKLNGALAEIENLKKKVYDESQKCEKLERIANEAIKRAAASEKQLGEEIKLREDIEKAAAVNNNRHDLILEELQTEKKEKKYLEKRLEIAKIVIKALKDKLSPAQFLIRVQYMKLKRQKLQNDARLQEIEELRQKKDLANNAKPKGPESFLEFTYPEIQRATNNFSDSLKIGEGGYGWVYKGTFQNSLVAVKVLDLRSRQGERAFKQEGDKSQRICLQLSLTCSTHTYICQVAILGEVRHPNIVSLVGACSEKCILVYEFLPNGSLADCLVCKEKTPPLTWRERSRIAVEICSALIHLHSSEPHPIVHGDLKPHNILLDANNVSKLGDFGISRLLLQSSQSGLFHQTARPMGTSHYMDPEFAKSGKLTRHSDVYSFGIVILQLITGMKPAGIIGVVNNAVNNGRFSKIIDPGTVGWPYVHARALVNVGLKCCKQYRKDRPDLRGEVWRVLEPMMMADSLPFSAVVSEVDDGRAPVPDYFLCPLSLVTMRDPQFAADGFTYEAEKIKVWFEEGNKNSPVTNLPVSNFDLSPNLSLRSEIQEWLNKHGRV